jgi:hypothetical protein
MVNWTKIVYEIAVSNEHVAGYAGLTEAMLVKSREASSSVRRCEMKYKRMIYIDGERIEVPRKDIQSDRT